MKRTPFPSCRLILWILLLAGCLLMDSLQAASFEMMEQRPVTITRGREARPAAGPATSKRIQTSPAGTVPMRLKPTARKPEAIKVLPDLTITRFTVSPATVISGRKTRLVALVKNNGRVSARGVVVSFTNMQRRKKVGEKTIAIGAGKTTRVRLDIPVRGKGRISLVAEVDPKQRIQENNERNNRATATVTVQPPPAIRAVRGQAVPLRATPALKEKKAVTPARTGKPRARVSTPPLAAMRAAKPSLKRGPRLRIKPDLVMVGLKINRKKFTVGQSVIARVTVKNSSPFPARNLPVALYLDRKKVKTLTKSLAANGTTTLVFRYVPKRAGAYTLKAGVDPDNRIAERNERNNTSRASLIVAAKRTPAASAHAALPKHHAGAGVAQTKITAKKVGQQRPTTVHLKKMRTGGVAATPISIPRTAHSSVHKKPTRGHGDQVASAPWPDGTRTPHTSVQKKLSQNHGRQVAFDPGMGPPNQARTNSAKKEITLPGKMTTYGPQPGPPGNPPPGGGAWKIITAPKENDKWERGKTHRIMWQPSGVAVTKVTWTNITTKANHDIFLSTTTPITADHIDWTIPRTMATGNYVITITADGAPVKSKNFLITMPAVVEASVKKPSLTLRPEIPSPEIKKGYYSSPRITYFDYSVSYVSNGYLLRLQFYWEDSGKDLHKGSWTFGYKYDGKWYKKSGAIAKLPYHDDFLGAKGMNTFEIPFDNQWKGKTIPVAFYLTDAMGLTSNVGKGTADFIDATSTSVSLRPPAPIVTTSDPITFIKPNSYINHLFVRGTKMDIQLVLNTNLKTQNPSIKIELIPVAKGANHSVIYNKPLPKDGHISWTIPKSIPHGAYFFKASSTNPSASAKSGNFSFHDKGISLITPKNGSHFQVGDTIIFQWKAFGLSKKESMNIITCSDGTHLNKKPIPIKDGSWSFIIKPGTMPTGKFPIAFRLNPSGDSIGEAFITVAYPKNIVPPGIIFKNPAPGATVKWLAGATEKIEWEQSGEYSENTQVTFILNSLDYSHPGSQHISSSLKKISMPASGHLKKISQVKISPKMPAGIYRLMAYCSLGTVGKGGVIEIIDQNADMLPAPDTKFSITGVDYPVAGGPLSVHIQINSPKPFRITNMGNQNWGTQYLAYRITNYALNGPKMGNIANDSISVTKNFSLFPQHVIPKGISNYTLKFRPKLIKPIAELTTLQDMHSTGPFSGGAICWHHYRPKLEIYLDTFLQGGRRSSEYKKIYLNDNETKGIGRKTHKFSGKTSMCTGGLYVEW